MKKGWRLAGIACLLATALLPGCGKRGGTSDVAAAVKDYVYRLEEMELSDKEGENYQILKGGDKLYAMGYEYGTKEGDMPRILLYSLSEEEKLQELGVIQMKDNNTSIGSLTPDGEGFFYGIENIYQPSGDGSYQDDYYLVKYTEQGEEVFRTYLNEIPELAALAEDYFYAGGICLAGGDIYVGVLGSYARFDGQGGFKTILKAKDGSSFDGVSLYMLEDGRVAATGYEETGVYAFHVDLDTGEITDKTALPGNAYGYSIYPGAGKYELYLVDSYGVYGYNVGDTEKQTLMNYLDSDLGISMLFNVVALNDREFLASYDDVETYETAFGRFTKVDPKDVKDRQTLVLACSGLDWDVRTAVVKFNKSNENYRITIQDYDSLYGSSEDYMAGSNRLNADLVSGRVPDILLLDSDMPVDSYISKGLFEDLKPFVEQDQEIAMEDLMPNIVEAFSTEGKMYRLVPNYSINTVLAKVSDVGSERGWTIQEARELLASKPEGVRLFESMTRDWLLAQTLTIAGDQFIDWEKGTCSFDSEGFLQLLEFAKEFPEQIDDTMYTDDYWENYDSLWREGRVIAQTTSIGDFRSFNRQEKGAFGQDIVLIGYPSANEDGSAIVPGFELAMSSKSSHQEGVWEFMRYFLTDEYQSQEHYGFPISITRLNEMGQEAMKADTYTDEEGNEVEIDDTYYVGGIEIKIPPMTQQEVEEFKEVLYSFTNVYRYDENLLQIVQEEAAPYFAGQKGAQETAAIIQSRVQVYVNENR